MVFAIHQYELALGTLVSLHPEPPSHLPAPIPPGCHGALASDSVGEGEGGMIGENGPETYTLPYVKWRPDS